MFVDNGNVIDGHFDMPLRHRATVVIADGIYVYRDHPRGGFEREDPGGDRVRVESVADDARELIARRVGCRA